MNGNELFPKFNSHNQTIRKNNSIRKKVLFSLVLSFPFFFSVSTICSLYAQQEAISASASAEILKKDQSNGIGWAPILKAFTFGSLPALFGDAVIRQEVRESQPDSLTLTIPIEAPKPAAQDIPKVTVDVTAVEKTLTPTSLPISQVTDQPAPGAEELGLKPGQTAAVVPQQPKQSLLSKWVRLFFQKKAPETTEPVLSDVERETKPLVMTPSLMEEPLDRIGRSVSVVSAEQIEAQGSQTLIEGIRNVPGVSVRQMGSLGDFSSIRIRGTRPWDTAILMEGMPLRDASDPQGSFLPFTEDLFTGHFSQIEVMRGTGSTLYGSEAIGGVINMRMKQGIEGRPHVKVELDGGTFGTIHHAYQVSGASKGFDYFLSYGQNDTEGIRSVDSYGSHIFGVNTGYQYEDRFEARFMVNATGSKLHVGDSPTLLNDVIFEDSADPNHIREARFVHYNNFVRFRINDHIQQKTKFAFMDTDRRFINGADQLDRVASDSHFDGNIANVAPELEVTLNEHYSVIGGFDYEREEFRQLVNNRWDSFDVYRYGPYLENRLSFLDETLNISAGGRVSKLEEHAQHESGEISGSYLVEKTNTRFKGHFGTGFREPSLYETYGRSLSSRGVLSVFGNPDLKPEKSISWDAGLEQKLFHESLMAAGAFFKNEFSRRIAFVGRQYAMREGGYSQGGEFELKWQPIKSIQLGASYTRTFSEADGRSITGLPRNIFGFNLDWKFWNRFHYHLDFTYNGQEQIALFSSTTFTTRFVDQKAYNKVDMKFSFDLNDYVTLWARGDNVFDANIHEDGFDNPGAQAFGGLSMEL